MPRRKNSSTVLEAEENTSLVRPMDDLLTIHEVAHRLRVDDTTVRRWINNGALEAVTLPHLGKRKGYRVRKTTLDALLNGTTMPV